MTLSIRKARPEDLSDVLGVFAKARSYMRAHRNPTQWGNDRPTQKTLSEDISNGNLYVVLTEDQQIHGCFAFLLGEDPTYAVIDGAWPNQKPYGVVHRIAQDGQIRGMFRAAFDEASKQTKESLGEVVLRCDTHEDNTIMQQHLLNYGFVYCGTIITDDNTPRRAYQLG